MTPLIDRLEHRAATVVTHYVMLDVVHLLYRGIGIPCGDTMVSAPIG